MTARDQIERRAAAEWRADGRRLVGHAAVFDQAAAIGSGTEIIRRGAFAKSIAAGADILALVDHDPKALLGRTRTGTLRLTEDARGLAFEIELPATTLGNDVLALATRGDLGGASFGFLIRRDRWAGRQRELLDVELREISVVHAWPAYPTTDVAARSRAEVPPALALARLKVDLL